MAKAKKKELSLEEKLEQALVPVEEQPYEVPGNWCWVKLGNVIELISGRDVAMTECNDLAKGIPYILGASNIKNDLFEAERWIEVPQVISKKGDILLSVKGTIGKLYIQNEAEINISRQIMAIRTKMDINTKMMYWYLNKICDELKCAGNGLIPGISREDILDRMFSLPPAAEQQRIVEQIESLFAKLDEAKDKLQEVLDNYDARITSMIRKAVIGELTETWRASTGLKREDWKTIALGKCGKWFGGGTPTTSKKEYWDKGTIPWITSKDMKEKWIEDSLLHITQAGVDNSSANYCDKPAVLFVMRSGILRRVFPVCMVKMPFTVNQDLKAVIPEKIQQEYLYWVCTAYEKDIRDNCMKSGTTVESIEAKKLQDYEIPLPTEDEQTEIVRIIEELTVKEESTKYFAEDTIDKIELMKKSILAKAFRGELGTNNPDEESAIELLKSILATE